MFCRCIKPPIKKDIIKKDINPTEKWTIELNILHKRWHPVAIKHMEMFSTSLMIREVKIKTLIKHIYILTKRTKIKKSDNTKYWWGCSISGIIMLMVMEFGTNSLRTGWQNFTTWSSNSIHTYVIETCTYMHQRNLNIYAFINKNVYK